MMELRTDRFKLFDVFPEKANRLAKSLHKKADQIEFIRKGIPIDPTDIKIEDGERAAIRLITTPRLDRDNEILIPEGAILDDFRQSPTVLYAHDYRGLPIGRDQWLKVTKRGILAKTQYATHNFAEDVYQCVKGGFLNSNSVGFIPLDAVNADDKKRFGELQDTLEKDYGVLKEESGKAKNIYTKWILLEHSDVPVASNAQSLNIAVSKGELPITSDRLKKDLGIELVIDSALMGDYSRTEVKIEDEPDVPEFQLEDNVEEKAEEAKEPEPITKPETTENYHRIPVEDSGDHKDHRIRTITISASKGIKALYCGECKKVITYLFDVDKWTMEEARAWVKDHKDASQAMIEKTLSTFGVPSISDIQMALDRLLNPSTGTDRPVESYKWIADLYPIAYPDGVVVWGMNDSNRTPHLFEQVYVYFLNGDAALGEEVKEVRAGYVSKPAPGEKNVNTTVPNIDIVLKVEEVIKKHGESQMSLITDLQGQVIELKAGRILPPESREQIQKCLEEMRHTADKLEELYEAVEPRAKEQEKEKPAEDKDFKFDPPQKNDGADLERAVAHALEKCLKPEFLSDIVKKAVEIKIKHLQGKVE